jgi:hypothetical protein
MRSGAGILNRYRHASITSMPSGMSCAGVSLARPIGARPRHSPGHPLQPPDLSFIYFRAVNVNGDVNQQLRLLGVDHLVDLPLSAEIAEIFALSAPMQIDLRASFRIGKGHAKCFPLHKERFVGHAESGIYPLSGEASFR